jgi:hypothetical protein
MEKIKTIILSLIILWIIAPVSAEFGPPPGDDSIEYFLARHMNMEEDPEIMDFVNTCGISDYKEVDVNRTHTYIYLIPKINCSNKLVFLEISGDIIWVQQIGMNETISFKQPGPLDGLFSAYPSAKKNETINSFIETYRPVKWKANPIDMNSSVVYIIAENKTFREISFLEKDENIIKVDTFDESKVSVSMTEAVEIAGNQLNSTISPQDVRIVFSGSEPFWAVTYMDGPTATTYFIDTENGDFYYYLSEATDRTDRNISKTIEGFIAASIIGILLMLILGMRKKT